MLKKSTLLSVSIFFLLFIGLSDSGYACHDGEKHNAPGTPCGGGGGGEVGEYSVVITGDLEGENGINLWLDGVGRGDSIGLSDVHGREVGFLMDLNYFVDQFTPPRGFNCFGGVLVPLPLRGANLLQGKGGIAQGGLSFVASTDDGLSDIGYVFRGFGLFEGDWPPLLDNTTSMILTDWELKVPNQDKTVRNISCIGEGPPDGEEFEVVIMVTREN